MPTYALNLGKSVVLATVGGVVTGQVSLSPSDFHGPSTWNIDTVILQTNRPGTAPVPNAQLYKGSVDPTNSQGLTYDGSFSQAAGQLTIVGSDSIICVWTGGQVGDTATMTITGTKF
jgi:hypothetical protein